MSKWGIPFAVLALVILGLVLSGILGGDPPAKGPRPAASSAGDGTRPGVEAPIEFSASGPEDTNRTSATPASIEAMAADIRPGAAGAIAGRVVDPSSTPIEGAVIHLVPDESPRGAGGRFAGFGVPLPEIDAEEGRTLTDAEGRFRYEGLAESASFGLVVRAEGWVGERRGGLRPAGDPVEFVLAAGEAVTGIVVDPAGRPVPGALVAAGPTVAELGEGIVLSVGGHFGEETAVLPVATSDAAGAFSLAGIPPGRFSIHASHDRYSPSHPLNLMQGQEGITLELRPNTVVEGRVVDESGAPVAGASVRSMSGMLFGDGPRRGGEAETDESGAFRLEGLSPGQIHLIARAEDRPLRGTPEPVTVGEGETVSGIEIVLARAARITGVIVDPAGTPLAGATIRLRDHAGDGGRGGRSSATSGEDGSFVLPAISPDPDAIEPLLHAHVEHPAHAEAESAPFTLRPGIDIDLGTIALVEAVTISGRITDLAGAPIEGAEVHLVRGGVEQGSSEFEFEVITASIGAGGGSPQIIRHGAPGGTTSDAAGDYRLRVREPGSFRVAAGAEGCQRAESAEIAVGDRSIAGIDIALPPALQITGLVVDELGLPCEGVAVRATAEGRGGSSERTGPDGRYRVDGLTAGPHLLDLAGEGWSLAGDPPQAEAGETGVTLVARRPGRIAGRIVDAASGRPVTTFTVRSAPDLRGGGVFSFGFDLGGVEYHDPDGRFLLEGIAPGSHRITAKAPGRVEGKATVEVASASTTEVTIALELAGIILGRVVDSAGAPVEGATVTWERIAEDGGASDESPAEEFAVAFSVGMEGGGGAFHIRGLGAGPARTDEDGRFRLDGIADGEVRVHIRHDSFRERTEEPLRARKGEETDAGTLVLERGSTLRGTVRLSGGSRPMWSNVRLFAVAGGEPRSSDVGDQGAYEIGGLDAGEYRVQVEYMVEPAGPPGERAFVDPVTHDAGTVRIATDEMLSFDIVIPGG